MDVIMTWAKENFDLITLMVAILGVVISVIGVIYEVKKKSLEIVKGKVYRDEEVIGFNGIDLLGVGDAERVCDF